jgi:hypothetical protein
MAIYQYGKQGRTPPRKEKAEEESSALNGSKPARLALGSIASPAPAAKELISSRIISARPA